MLLERTETIQKAYMNYMNTDAVYHFKKQPLKRSFEIPKKNKVLANFPQASLFFFNSQANIH